MEDNRIFERFSTKFPLRFIDLKDSREGIAQVRDISAKGVCMITNEQLQPYTSLEMWLQIPDRGEPLYTRGEVIWSRLKGTQYHAGINLERADMMGLSRVLRAL